MPEPPRTRCGASSARGLWNGPAAALLLLHVACASGGPRSVSRSDPDLITAEEIGATTAQNVYDVIQQRRPRWLQRERPTSVRPEQASELLVYVDNVRFGPPELLRSMSPAAVVSIRYLSASEAQSRFGPGHLQGVLHVTTRP